MRTAALTLALLGVVVLTGCVGGMVPLYAPIGVDLKGPVAMGSSDAAMTKTGTATATAIILLAQGDASIQAAMRDAQITKVHHVDYEMTNILGLYAKYTTYVYGE